MGRLIAAATIVVAFTLALHVLELEAGCCRSCVFYCCSRGPCNAFCCNCEHHNPLCQDDRDCGCYGWPEWPYGANKYIGSKGKQHQLGGAHGPVSSVADVRSAQEVFDHIDANGDGVLGIGEAVAFLVSVGMDYHALMGNTTWWQEMDQNHNGYLEPKEFDFMLG
jgi:hypothetical protein